MIVASDGYVIALAIAAMLTALAGLITAVAALLRAARNHGDHGSQ